MEPKETRTITMGFDNKTLINSSNQVALVQNTSMASTPMQNTIAIPIRTVYTTQSVSKTRNHADVLSMMHDMENLNNENEQLATITRLCIHLVDRCRALNKSKQFIEDMHKLGQLIDKFNQTNTRKTSPLPSFGNSGLVFVNSANQQTSNSMSKNMVLIPNGNSIVFPNNSNNFGQSGSQSFVLANNFKEVSKNLSQSNSGITIPLLNDSNLFSILNTTDNLNIENTPNLTINTDKGSKEYRCEICDKVFVNSYNQNRHMRSHTGSQQFVCNYPDCKKRFNYSYHLKRHMETHTGERPFSCTWPNCDLKFNRKYNLNRHLWVHTEKQCKLNI